MIKLLIEKELKAVMQSPKFVATFGVCSILILLSVFVGIQEFRASESGYETASQLLDQQIAESTSFYTLENRVYREPNPMQIFVSGVTFDVGRVSEIGSQIDVKLEQRSRSSPFSASSTFRSSSRSCSHFSPFSLRMTRSTESGRAER
jgi:hypothetical protein